MEYEKFIDSCIQAMQDGMFKQKYAQQSKTFSNETIEANAALSSKIKNVFLHLIDSDVYKGHSSVMILAESNFQIQKILINYIAETLGSICKVLKTPENVCHGQQYCTTIKALYSLLQYIFPHCSITTEMKILLKEIMMEIEHYIISDKIAIEISLIYSSTFVLLISLTCECPREYFEGILMKSFQFRLMKNNSIEGDDPTVVNDDTSGEKQDNNDINYNKDSNEIDSCITYKVHSYSSTTYGNLNLINGVLNVKPKWLLEVESINNEFFTTEKSCLLFRLWPLIKSHCSTASIYSYQCIQVLQKWIEILSQFIKSSINQFRSKKSQKFLNSLNIDEQVPHCESLDMSCPNDELCFPQPLNNINSDESLSSSNNISSHDCELCNHPSLGYLLSTENGQIVELLNICFEKKGKGIANLTLECLKELLGIHVFFCPGHDIFYVEKILKLISSNTLHSNGTYLHIQIALEILGPHKVFEDYPSLPSDLVFGLKTNQFTSVTTNVYCVILSQLSILDWLRYFKSVHLFVIRSPDQVLWSNYKNLWLPETLSYHPDLVTSLMKLSDKSIRDLEVKIVVLRIFRSISDKNIFGEYCSSIPDKFEDFMALCIKESAKDQKGCEMNSDPTISESSKYCDLNPDLTISKSLKYTDNTSDLSFPEPLFYLQCLVHGNENIRSELFSLLCLCRKTSLALCEFEIILLKGFLTQNMNVDSQSFRQSIMKSFQSLVCRIRDSSMQQIKKFKELNEDCVKSVLSSHVGLGVEFLIWLINFFNDNLNSLGNYPRLATTLNLYHVLLSMFYGYQKSSLNNEYKCKRIGNLLSWTSKTLKRNQDLIYSNFTTRMTLNLLLKCCTNEMNDIRELARNCLSLLYKNNALHNQCCQDGYPPVNHDDIGHDFKSLENWFSSAFQMIDSPKTNEVESGANLITVLLEIQPEIYYDFINHKEFSEANSSDSGATKHHERLINYLLWKIETEFKCAKTNILRSAYTKPISGTILILTSCLVECQSIIDSLNIEFIVHVVSSLAKLYNELATFVLNSLSSCSSDGPRIPPSFADMGKSIDALVEKYQSSKMSFKSSQEDKTLNVKEVNGMPSHEEFVYDHQMILSFFWQLLKTCCWSASKLTQKYLSYMSDNIFEKFLVETVMLVLVGTRHKGAMESAQESLAVLTQCAFHEAEKSGQTFKSRIRIVEQQLDGILESLESSENIRKISTTRRAAGCSMLFTAICANIPRRYRNITDKVIERLLNIAQKKVEPCLDSGSVDLPSSLSLHILHSMVSSSKMSSAVSSHLPRISIVSLQGFASEIWSVRNAALHLFGAVVPKLLGQKKVKDDTAIFNSITASEFCNRNSALTSVILNILIWCSDVEDVPLNSIVELKNDVNLSASCKFKDEFSDFSNLSIDRESVKLKSSSFLVPLLSLLARLNPGNEVQQNEEVRRTLNRFIVYILPFLGNSFYSIRRLAATSLVALSSKQEKEAILNELCTKSSITSNITHQTKRNSITSALNWGSFRKKNNSIHGLLLFVENILNADPNFLKENSKIHNGLSNYLQDLLLNSKCHVNICLALNILSTLDYSNVVFNLKLSYSYSCEPGSSDLLRNIIRLRLRHNAGDVLKLILSDNQDVWEESIFFVKETIQKPSELLDLTLLQQTLWIYLKDHDMCLNNNSYVKVCNILELLSLILEYSTLDWKDFEQNLKFLQTVFNYDNNLQRHASVVLSYFINKNVEVSKLMSKWAVIVHNLSDPKMSEDCRLCASKALQVSFEHVLNGGHCKEVVIPLIRASINLLQDEDCNIRMNSSCIIKTKVFHDSTVINPSYCLSVLINRLVKLSLANLDYIILLWDLSIMEYRELETTSNFSYNLFDSGTNNSYSEPSIISAMICSELYNRKIDCCSTIEVNLKSNLSNFIAEKEFFLRNLSHSLRKEVCTKDKPLFINYKYSSKIAVLSNGLKFLQDLTLLFDIRNDFNFQEHFKIIAEIQNFIF